MQSGEINGGTSILQIEKKMHPSPTPVVSKLIKYIVGFSVGIGVGLSPFLGMWNVPLFKPLLELIPQEVHIPTIPLSALFIGIIAIVLQWHVYDQPSKKSLRKLFFHILTCTLIFSAVLFLVYMFTVVSIPIDGGAKNVTFLVGFTRPDKPPCTINISDAECISKYLTFDPVEIHSFWGETNIRISKISLISSYILATMSFCSLIGLIILQEIGVSSRKTKRPVPNHTREKT